MSDLVLHHADILPPGAAVHLTRAELGPARPRALHGHDFYELLWVLNGRLRHHLPERTEEIAEGGLLLVRPGDVHGLQGRGAQTLVVSLTIAPDLVADIAARHPGLGGQLFWQEGDAPLAIQRDSRQLATLNRAANVLDLSRCDRLAAEAFLLPLLSELATDTAVETAAGAEAAPDWLRAARAAAREPSVFREGAAGLARIAGRAHPHVSRSMRRFFGQSPSEYVNAQRMAFAARRLAGSGDSLTEIATECGIPNLSHFHKLFRAAHGLTPLRYRKTHQHDVLRP